MFRQFRSQLSNLSRTFRLLPPLLLIAVLCIYTSWDIQDAPPEVVEQHVIKQSQGVYGISKGPLPSVNVVVASTSTEDYSWVGDLKVPNFNIIPYIAGTKLSSPQEMPNNDEEPRQYKRASPCTKE